jgi:chromosome segregation ATPase
MSTPYEQNLLERREALVQRIENLKGQLRSAELSASDRIAALPVNVPENLQREVVRPVTELAALITAHEGALARLDEEIAEAPALLERYEHELKALEIGRDRVEKAKAEAISALEAFLDANDALVGEYRQAKVLSRGAMKTWQDLGRPGDAPGLARFQWPHEMSRRARGTSLIELSLVGDTSGLA